VKTVHCHRRYRLLLQLLKQYYLAVVLPDHRQQFRFLPQRSQVPLSASKTAPTMESE
jgi:hypothetical protein